jgi:type IV/VI secretion system ImpK/VasF family protein
VLKKNFLLDAFEEFYVLIDLLKEKIEKSLIFDLKDDQEIKNLKVANMQNDMYLFIQEKSSKIFQENGKIGEEIFQEVIYCMSAMADEVFLSFDWEGKLYWRNNLLERKLFKTANAGEKIFQKIQSYLNEKSYKDDEIGMIYYEMLSLNFKGNQRSWQDCEKYIQNLKEQLFYKIYQIDSHLSKKDNPLVAQVYENLFLEGSRKEPNPLKIWIFLTSLLIGGYVVLANTIWYSQTYKIFLVFNRLNERKK